MITRIEKLRSLIPNDDFAVLITSDVNRLYFSGFKSSAGAVLISMKSATLFVDFRYFEAAQKNVEDINVVCYKSIYDSINDVLVNENIRFVYLEDESVTVAQEKKLSKCLKCEVLTDFNLSDKIHNLRMIKSKTEIDKVKIAQAITEKSYTELLNFIKPGVSERKLALELEYLMKCNGAESVAFDIIAISGENTSLPHGVPTERQLKNGDFITFDIGSVYEGYHSDMTRTIALGFATEEMEEVYDVVLCAHHKAAKLIKAGSTCSDVDNAARDYITSKGYGEYFGHTTGHGVGLEIHETPTVYYTNKTILQTNTIITNEPGIYLPNKFGVRIEDMYLVTDTGCEDLAKIDKELIIL